MGTTAKGYPYPEDTDPVAQGAQAIKSLATQIDTRLGSQHAGSVNITFANAPTATAAVTFPAGRFNVTPAVALGTNTSTYIEGAGGIDTTGFTFTLRTYNAANSTSTITGFWVARTPG